MWRFYSWISSEMWRIMEKDDYECCVILNYIILRVVWFYSRRFSLPLASQSAQYLLSSSRNILDRMAWCCSFSFCAFSLSERVVMFPWIVRRLVVNDFPPLPASLLSSVTAWKWRSSQPPPPTPTRTGDELESALGPWSSGIWQLESSTRKRLHSEGASCERFISV